VRAALGAGRARIAWSCCWKVCASGLLGGVLGVGIAYEGLRLLAAIGPANLPRLGKSPWMVDRSGSPSAFRCSQACYLDPFRHCAMPGRAPATHFAAPGEPRA